MNGINAVSSPRQVDSTETSADATKKPPSGGPFTKAFTQLSEHMDYLSTEAQEYYATLEQKVKLSKDVDPLLQQTPLDTGKAKTFLERHYPQDKPGWSKQTGDKKESDSGYEQRLREGLENFKASQTDFVAESQLKIQRVMQTYNTTATLMNSLQSMLAELNKTIIQAMR